MFKRFPYMNAAGDNGGGGGDGGAAAAAAAAAAAGNNGGGAAPAEWLKPFGEHGKAFESFKEPAELATKWTEMNTELTALKGKQAPDWRAQVAGDDPEALKALGRFQDPKAFYKSFNEAQTKIRAGELAKPLAADATPEQVKAWREANGVPLEAKGYLDKLPNGLVIGKDDQPTFERYASIWHQHNLPPAAAQAMAAAYYEDLNKVQAAEREVDKADSLKTTTELRTKYGPDYESNMSILNNWVDGMPEESKALFLDATLGDGTRLFNSPEVVDFLIRQAREVNPVAHLIPSGGGNPGMTLDAEIKKWEGQMKDRKSDYWKDEKNQQRLRDLYTAKGQMQRTG